jgi:hypothetical protein
LLVHFINFLTIFSYYYHSFMNLKSMNYFLISKVKFFIVCATFTIVIFESLCCLTLQKYYLYC